MEIDATICIDNDRIFNELEDDIRCLAEEVVEENQCSFTDYDEVNSLIDEKVPDAMAQYAEAIELTTTDNVRDMITTALDDTNTDINGELIDLRNDVTILKSRIRVIEGYLTQVENRRIGSRLKRLGGTMSKMARKVHWHMPRR
jgi:hypothetical protein